MKCELYAYQKEALDFAYETKYSINGFQMGLGKSAVGLALHERVGGKALVVCPAYLKQSWKDEAEKFLENPDIDFYSYGAFGSVTPKKKYSVVIFDEAHYLKNPTAKRTAAAHEYVSKAKPEYLLMLSGTPIKNHVSEIWSLLKLCDYGPTLNRMFKPYSKSHWAFCNQFSYKETTYQHYYKWAGLKGAKTLIKMLEPWYIRKRADEVLDLPKQVRKKINLNPNKYEESLLEAFESYLDGKKAEHISEIKTTNAIAKTKGTIDLAKDTLNSGEKVVIFSDHIFPVDEIYRGLSQSYRTFRIMGGTDMATRAEHIKSFTDSLYPCAIVATIGSMSVGVNLQAANHMIFNDIPWVPADLIQAEKRIHRIGQDRSCFYYYLFASKTDEQIFKTLLEKTKIVNQVINNT